MSKVLFALALCLAVPALAGERFTFAAIGDMPYVRDDAGLTNPEADRNREFAGLIGRINRAGPAFTVHVGDIKSGRTVCTDAHLAYVRTLFDRFEAPLVYTPGDNEWTDCHRRGGNPLERLARIRQFYFAQPQSLGQRPMPLAVQAGYPENGRWSQGGVLFATLNVPGSNNNRRLTDEYEARNAAVLDWLRGTFARARAEGAKAVALFMQANPGWFCTRPECEAKDGDGIDGYRDLLAALDAELAAYPRPVLLVHGDTHVFSVDKPLMRDKRRVMNFTRLEVFGEDDTHAVLVGVDPDDPEVFSFLPLR
ncbi:MAG: hypothetical protein HYU60_07245 [Magnetospirillum sp.]|nr:hypothetical protein [Magnetospirillum sp.]